MKTFHITSEPKFKYIPMSKHTKGNDCATFSPYNSNLIEDIENKKPRHLSNLTETIFDAVDALG
jgi:hypothetical protein